MKYANPKRVPTSETTGQEPGTLVCPTPHVSVGATGRERARPHVCTSDKQAWADGLAQPRKGHGRAGAGCRGCRAECAQFRFALVEAGLPPVLPSPNSSSTSPAVSKGLSPGHPSGRTKVYSQGKGSKSM